MPKHVFSGSKSDLLPEIEKFRELQAFCSHDLRSQIGAVAGLLSLIEAQVETLDAKTKSSFTTALTSAQEALDHLDLNTTDARPNFDVSWLIGFSDDEIAQTGLQDALQARGLARVKPILFLNFAASHEWQSRVKKYRPLTIFFKSRADLGPDAATWIPRLGPQLTKIYLFDEGAPELNGVRADAVTVLKTPATLSELGELVLGAIESLPHGRN